MSDSCSLESEKKLPLGFERERACFRNFTNNWVRSLILNLNLKKKPKYATCSTSGKGGFSNSLAPALAPLVLSSWSVRAALQQLSRFPVAGALLAPSPVVRLRSFGWDGITTAARERPPPSLTVLMGRFAAASSPCCSP